MTGKLFPRVELVCCDYFLMKAFTNCVAALTVEGGTAFHKSASALPF